MLKSTPVPHRDLLPDLIRAWALIGIVLVNMEMFSGGLNAGYPDFPASAGADHLAEMLVTGLFALKSYSLFSMMFGAGLGYQMASAVRSETSVKGRYFRRIAGLLLLGILHVVFLFLGDILVTYAILGSLLYLCRNARPKTLIIWGIALIIIQASLMLLGSAGMAMVESVADPATRRQFDVQMQQQAAIFEQIDMAFADGSFLQVVSARLSLLPGLVFTVIMVQGISAFGFFLIGLAFFKSGLLSDPHHKFWKTSLFALLPLGLIVSFYGANAYLAAPARDSSQGLYGMGVMILASPLSSFGYAGLIALIARKAGGPVIRFLARGGSATLTAYLMQSVILCFVTLEFGLGFYQELPAYQATLIALVTGVFTLCFVSLWLKAFKRGPMEILLRRWTYLGYKQPMERETV